MTLDTENAKLFFKLFLPILDYVNLKCRVLENDEKFMEKWTLSQGINVQSALKTANKLWPDDTLDFLGNNPFLTQPLYGWQPTATGDLEKLFHTMQLQRFLTERSPMTISQNRSDDFCFRGSLIYRYKSSMRLAGRNMAASRLCK